MTVRLATHELVGLLTDLALTTADPTDSGATAGILLHTARGYLGDQPGAADLLIGTSTDSVVVGHAHTGDNIRVAEDPDLFGDGLTLTFGSGDVGEYPVEQVRSLLTDTQMSPPEGSAPSAPRTDFLPKRLQPFLKVATRRNSLLEIYRYHQRLPVAIQIGPQYRGMASPFAWRDEDRAAGMAPSGDVYPLPDTH